jgi:outer membrane protein W
MVGVDYNLSNRFYITSELRYGSHRSLDLEEEDGNGRVTNIDYQPVTLGLGVGIRF